MYLCALSFVYFHFFGFLSYLYTMQKEGSNSGD